MSSSTTRPLIGEGNGVFRVHIVGNSGSGKTTLSKELGEILSVPSLSLDTVFWKPNWEESSRDEFRQRLTGILDSEEYSHGWVVDGNYSVRVGDLVDARATDVIWLDPPFFLYFPRLVKRTILRLFGWGRPCSPGCDETFSSVFLSRDSIIWWCMTHHYSNQERNRTRMQTRGIDKGGNIRRIGGWGGELEEWKVNVGEMVKSD